MNSTLVEKLNKYGKDREPILFIIDFDVKDFHIYPIKDVPKDILYKFDNFSNEVKNTNPISNIKLQKNPMPFSQYEKYFKQVQEQIRHGRTYMLNLSFPTNVSIYPQENISLRDVFANASSKFKLLIDNKFVSFSPERFIQTSDNAISTYPIKGTIDASIHNASKKIVDNIKESAEHTMIVDLLRNDLGIIGSNVDVKYFRHIEKINAGDKELLQVSSKIQASLEQNWQDSLGDKICSLLPAGSISGTPKKKSVEIINKIEKQHRDYNRDFFCGVCGYFDGENIDSFVLIRFLEQIKDRFIYKSGGGITSDSDPWSEYQEMLDKVYVPNQNVF